MAFHILLACGEERPTYTVNNFSDLTETHNNYGFEKIYDIKIYTAGCSEVQSKKKSDSMSIIFFYVIQLLSTNMYLIDCLFNCLNIFDRILLKVKN